MLVIREIFGFSLLGLYCLSSVAYFIRFLHPDRTIGRWASPLFRLTLLVHFIYLLVKWDHLGRLPLYSRFEILALVVFCYAAIYLIIEWRTNQYELGGFVISLATVFFAVSLFSLGQKLPANPTLRGLVFTVHVLTLILAYSSLFLGFLFSGLYLLMHYQIKEKRLGRIYNRFPPLDSLDTMTLHANMLGFVFLTIGIIAGSLWAKHVWDIYFGADPKLIATVAIWGIYACYLSLRLVPCWTRKRSAFLSIFGFFNLVFAFALLTSVASSTHNF